MLQYWNKFIENFINVQEKFYLTTGYKTCNIHDFHMNHDEVYNVQ
jgi:hypothetical protein